SSRRRHTRFSRDWSSDVCSSDLGRGRLVFPSTPRWAPLPPRPLPWVGVPTTAGAGAEMTPNAVLTDEETNVKKSLRDWSWLAARSEERRVGKEHRPWRSQYHVRQ